VRSKQSPTGFRITHGTTDCAIMHEELGRIIRYPSSTVIVHGGRVLLDHTAFKGSGPSVGTLLNSQKFSCEAATVAARVLEAKGGATLYTSLLVHREQRWGCGMCWVVVPSVCLLWSYPMAYVAYLWVAVTCAHNDIFDYLVSRTYLWGCQMGLQRFFVLSFSSCVAVPALTDTLIVTHLSIECCECASPRLCFLSFFTLTFPLRSVGAPDRGQCWWLSWIQGSGI
jgi:hypothetical protein